MPPGKPQSCHILPLLHWDILYIEILKCFYCDRILFLSRKDEFIFSEYLCWVNCKILFFYSIYVIAVVQSLSYVQFFATPWISAHQASLSFTISQSFLKLMSIESVMPSNSLILCRPLLLLPSIFPSIRVFSSESAFCIKWPKCFCGISYLLIPCISWVNPTWL